MDSGSITAITALLGLLGAGVGFLIRRADKRRENNEALLIQNLKDQLAAEKKKARRWERAYDLVRADATEWREQLIKNDIEPAPQHWTPIPEEDE